MKHTQTKSATKMIKVNRTYILKIQRRQRKQKSIQNHDDCAILHEQKKGKLRRRKQRGSRAASYCNIYSCICYGNVSSYNRPPARPTIYFIYVLISFYICHIDFCTSHLNQALNSSH